MGLFSRKKKAGKPESSTLLSLEPVPLETNTDWAAEPMPSPWDQGLEPSSAATKLLGNQKESNGLNPEFSNIEFAGLPPPPSINQAGLQAQNQGFFAAEPRNKGPLPAFPAGGQAIIEKKPLPEGTSQSPARGTEPFVGAGVQKTDPSITQEVQAGMQSQMKTGSSKLGDEDFQLPDFNDEELNQLEKLEIPQKPTVKDWSKDSFENNSASKAGLLEAQEPGIEEKQETSLPRINKLLLSESKHPILKGEGLDLEKEKFVGLQAFFKLLEDLSSARGIARNAEEQMFAQNYKDKDEAFRKGSSAFNTIQDKLMAIDTKLFEEGEGALPEVNG